MSDFGLSSKFVLAKYANCVVESLRAIKHFGHDVHANAKLTIDSDDARDALEKWEAFLQEYKTSGMPPVTFTRSNDSGGGEFQPYIWTLEVGCGDLSLASKIRLAACEELASSLYHEMRHAEQFFAMAYYLASANPKMEADEISPRLYYMHRPTVVKAKELAAQRRRTDLFNFGKSMFDGEFKLNDPQVKLEFESQKDDLDTWLGNRERVIFTNEVGEAGNYINKVCDEIRAYNAARPSRMPQADDIWDLHAPPKFKVFYSELAAALQKHGSKSEAFFKAYHMYLAAKKLFAEDYWRKAYLKYMQTTTESDAHKIEMLLRVKCEDLGLAVDRGSVRGVPDPVRWPPPPPPPPRPLKPPPPKQGTVPGVKFGVKVM